MINMVKPSKSRLKQIYKAPKHRRTKNLASGLSPDMRSQYGTRSTRVTKGDSVKVLLGEYKGMEGKVTKVHISEGRVAIEGIQREKVKGGNVPVLIHASNLMVVGLNLNDKWRKAVLERKRKGD